MLGNTFGRCFRVTCCGESYGTALLTIVDGVPAGLELKKEDIQKDLERRRPGRSAIDSPRKETDRCEIVSGMRDGYTTGAPVGITIYNVDRQDIHVKQYHDVKDLIRPGHAEYTFFVKYGEHADWCGAGRASGRETAGRVAGGAVAKKILAREGVEIIGYVKEAAGVAMREMSYEEKKANLDKNDINCPDLEAAKEMEKQPIELKEKGDTAGGIVELVARGVPPGVGEPVFDKLQATICCGIMSIGAVKGVEGGAGFAGARMPGSEFNDEPYLDEDKRVRFRTNNAGGFLGGISNGDDIVVRFIVKPTSTVSIPQKTVNMKEMKEVELAAITRRDATICGRIVPVGEAMMAMAITDALMMWRGYDALQKFEHKWK